MSAPTCDPPVPPQLSPMVTCAAGESKAKTRTSPASLPRIAPSASPHIDVECFHKRAGPSRRSRQRNRGRGVMNQAAIGRRTFVAGAAALTASGALQPGVGCAQTPVPNSFGTEPAKVKAPANATDCHMHIYDPRFPQATPRPGKIPANATVTDYRLLQKRNGKHRGG